MTAQLALIPPADAPAKLQRKPAARVITTVDGQRLGQQCVRILEMLRARPQLNSSLAAVSLKYTSRISDLRAKGYVIKCDRISDGLTQYRLVSEPGR